MARCEYVGGDPLRSIVSLGLQLSSSAGRPVSPPIYIAQGGYQQFDPEGPNYCGGVAPGLYIYPDKITQQALLSILQAVSKFPANSLRTWFMQYYGSDSEPEDCPPERHRGLPNKGGATHGSITFLASSGHAAAKMADQNLMWIGARSWAGQSSCSRLGGWQALAWVPVSC